jgi:hypothetical protein
MSGDFSGSGHNVTCAGDPLLVGEEWVFDGVGAYLSMPDHSDFTLDGDFTIELFGVKFAADTTAQSLVAHYNTTGDWLESRSFFCGFLGSASPKVLRLLGSTGGTSGTTTTISGTFTPTLNAAYNITFERSGSTVRIYAGADGDDLGLVASGTLAGSLFNSAAPVTVGCHNPDTPTDFFNGRLKALRITKGTARYANDAGYTPPTLPLPTS